MRAFREMGDKIAISGELFAFMWRRKMWWMFPLVFTLVFTLSLCYENGAYNTFGFPRFFNGNPKAIFSKTLSKVRNPFPTDWTRLIFAGGGALVMGVLTLLKSRLSWWRLHPIGFAMSAMINTRHLVMPIFFAWTLKVHPAVGGRRADVPEFDAGFYWFDRGIRAGGEPVLRRGYPLVSRAGAFGA